jgi:two-component sensor histidine kinase
MSARDTVIKFPKLRAIAGDTRENEQPDDIIAGFQAALAREAALRREIGGLLRRQQTLTQEFECRLLNGVEAIASLLSWQSEAATTLEAATQMHVAAHRVVVKCRSSWRQTHPRLARERTSE